MGKYLWMALIGLVAWIFYKKRAATPLKPPKSPTPPSAAGRVTGDASQPNANNTANADPVQIERMVACSACGVFMPETDSVTNSGNVSCRDPASCAHRPSPSPSSPQNR